MNTYLTAAGIIFVLILIVAMGVYLRRNAMNRKQSASLPASVAEVKDGSLPRSQHLHSYTISPEAIADSNTREKPLVLIIDDSCALRRLIAEMLQSEGYLIVQASSGMAGQDGWGKYSPDCVLLDLHLPDMDGTELLRRMRGRGSKCPVVLMTAFGDPQLLSDAEQYGYEGLLMKPFDLIQVKTTITQLTGFSVKQSNDSEANSSVE